MRVRGPAFAALCCAGFFTACAPSQETPGGGTPAADVPEIPSAISPSRTWTSIASETPTPTPTPTPSASPTPTSCPTVEELRYVFPVQPQERADFAAGGHAYPATDIFAEIGSDFVAVTDGVVDFVSFVDLWDPATDDPAVAGGLCVAIVGDDGIRYYGSHLSMVARGIRQGVRVEAGRLLGRVGISGNAAKTPPHLHFGISHPTYPEDWLTRRGELDPYPYLVAWSRGENVTPQFPAAAP
jgi:murein DD-endopeptidase MepM/ murein hydrolase activator NlpD